MEYTLGYREVIPDQTLPEKWKEIILNIGESQSTLQDIKVPERAGGYCFKDSSKYYTRNRFISWRISHDTLEMVEYSFDINLSNNRVKYKFTNTPVLDAISIHETDDMVIILIVTVFSIHKLSFTHPQKNTNPDSSLQALTMQSIFNEASVQNASDPHTFHVIPNAGLTNCPVAHAAASWLTMSQEESIFAFAYSSGNILLLRLNNSTGSVHSSELKHDSIVPRFLSGIAIAFRGRTAEIEIVMSLIIHAFNSDTFLFTLCRDGQLKIWSCNKIQFISIVNLSTENRIDTQNFQNYGLKKYVNSDNELYLCIHLKYVLGSEFFIFKVIEDTEVLNLIRICTLTAPNQHLVDFSFTITRLWAVWRTNDIDGITVTHAQIPEHNTEFDCEWESAILVNPPEKDYVMSNSGIDPRQAYINFIFHPGQFSLMDIIRALNIYRKSNFLTDMNLSPSMLKEKVCMAVEIEIQAEVRDYELMDEDYLEIVNRCWAKFYSCVLQYHLNSSRPTGILLLSNVYGIILLKKSYFSLLRPMEVLEHLTLCNENSYIWRFKTTPILSQNESTCQDMINLFSTLVMLEEYLTDDLKSNFEKDLYHLKGPDALVEKLVHESIIQTDDLFSDFDFQSMIYHKLENVKDISSAMALLLEMLTNDLGQPNKLKFNKEEYHNSDELLYAHHCFGSQLGDSVISEMITQITTLRFSICRNLLILQQIVLSRPELFDSQSLYAIKSSLAPRTVVITQGYYVVMWICESSASVIPSQILLESSIQRLSSLNLSNCKTLIGQTQQRSFSLLESFMCHSAKQYIRILNDYFTLDTSTSIFWHFGMLSHASLIMQLIWPMSDNFFFPEWLLHSCQFLLVQEYVRLLSTWCEWNSASRKFILAVSLLEMGEAQKACDYFLRASSGVIVDTYLSDLLSIPNDTSEICALVYYYLKVIELFKHHNASDCIIELALTAITVAGKDDSNVATLHSIIFEQNLILQHYIESYNCLNTNPDIARRVDCLRQLVVTLFNQKKLIDLIAFPYVDMYHDLEEIMETRARSIDLMENNYYDFLYSFHINKGNVRKAAFVKYEQAMRLKQEPFCLPIITRQTHCLLACINTLYLAKEKYRWILRPNVDQNQLEERHNSRIKRTLDGDKILQYKIIKNIEVLELADIKKEYILADAKLKLIKLNSNIHLTMQTSPLEVVSIMSSIGLYANALSICESYKLCKSSVLEILASQCIRLSQKDNLSTLKYLNQNDIFDFSSPVLSTVEVSWKLLQRLIFMHEKDKETHLHKAVSKKLFYCGFFLPEWLFSSYAKRNASELLRLMIQMGRLNEATEFSLELIKKALEKSKGFQNSLIPAPFIHIPFNTLEVLLLELECASKDDETYLKDYNMLYKTLENYLKEVGCMAGSNIKN